LNYYSIQIVVEVWYVVNKHQYFVLL